MSKKVIRKKTRPAAFEIKEALSPEQQSQLRSFLDGHTYKQAGPWVQKTFGIKPGKGALERFYHKHDAMDVLALIASGGLMNRKLDEAYAKNPAPAIERLVEVTKTLIQSLQIMGAADPEMLELANAMFKTALEYLKEQGKNEDRKLDREKYETEAAEKMLDKALRAKADELNASSLSQAAKIAEMRKAAFKDVDELQKSGKLKIPKA